MTTQPERKGIEEIVGKFRTMARSSVDSSDIGDWLRTTLHQELQKARKEAYQEGRESRQSEIDFLRHEAYGEEIDQPNK